MVSTTLAVLNNNNQNFTPTLVQPKKPSQVSKNIDKVIQEAEHVWSYFSKMMAFTKHALTFTLKTSKRIAESPVGVRITSAITHIKFLAIFGLPFLIASIPEAGYKFLRNVQLRDKEGAVLAGLSFAILIGDAVDSIGSIVNTGLTIASKIPLEFISVIGMPISFVIVGLSSVVKSVQMAKSCMLYHKLKKEVVLKIDPQTATNQEIHQTLWKFLDKKLGLGDKKTRTLIERMKELEKMPSNESREEMKKIQKKLHRLLEKKKAKLQREAPPNVVNNFEKIFDVLKKNKELSNEQVNEIVKDLDHVMGKFKKKIAVDVGNLISNILTIIGLSLVAGGVSAPIAIIFFVAALLIKLALQIYQDVEKSKAKKVAVSLP